MIWKTGTMQQFMHYVENKVWYIYGAGKRFNELQSYKELQTPTYIIDGNVDKQYKRTTFNGNEIEIISKEKFLRLCKKGEVLLITMYDFVDLFYDLEGREELENVECFLLDAIYLEDQYANCFSKRMMLEQLKQTGEEIIPRKIHYCWFGGGEMPEESKEYIDGWKKMCPDYEIIRWDESNYDVHKNSYMSSAYKAKKWAFVSDYARIDVVNTYGGIYLDVDVELVKPLDVLLKEEAFCGFQNDREVSFGLGFGACAHNKILEEILELYAHLEWDGGKVACPVYQTEAMKTFGLELNNSFQRLEQFTILPASVLCGCGSILNRKVVMEETIAVHHFQGSWYQYSNREVLLKKWFLSAESI